MTLLRFVLLVLAASMLVAADPAAAAPPDASSTSRSPLEAPEPVRTVKLHLTGSDMLDAVAEAGFDLSSGPVRVPTGVEVEAVVSDSEIAALEAMGAQVAPEGRGLRVGLPAGRRLRGPVRPSPAC